ncbi:GT2 family glycosyltransferase [Nocardioides sp. J9]|uniref:glycosyltransferase family 2 protein n=1 Tax=unclassified Nocardioides TaxID=2615069 RepID=UPI0004B2659E|nr:MULTISPECIES: glycosyltransferase family 2 protein [unclassified Nocardioides]TWG99161.1 GT2 family glycosyltransferase [Nocardioides sp. J9]
MSTPHATHPSREADPGGTARPDVDVVIATHHRPQEVREAIAAVLEQEYAGRVRVLVVFDGSDPDPSLARPGDHRSVEVLVNQRRRGLAGARNTGILTSTAELVAFCDDDDLWLPGKLERQAAMLASGGPATCVTGIEVTYDGTSHVRVPSPEDLDLRNLVRHRVMEAHPSTVVVRRTALLDDIGLVDEDIPGSYGEDFDWMIRAAMAGGFHVVPAPLARVRWGGSQFSRNWSTIAEAIDYGLAKHAVFHDDRRALARLLGRKAFALAAMRRRDALAWSLRSARQSVLEPRAYLSALVALRLVSADRLLATAHRHGRGI